VINFVSDLRQIGGTPVSSTNKSDHHDITKIVLKAALNTIKQTNKKQKKLFFREKHFLETRNMILFYPT
jgi:hypothetical protein